MKKPIILELRGTGVLLRVCSIVNKDMKALEDLAKAYGEELSTAWFDPAFRWRNEVRTILDQISVVSEYRGLLIDGRSFLEIRQLRKRRKFTMTELLTPNQLFPLVKSNAFTAPAKTNGENIVLEITHGTGCIGRFEADVFNLAELELAVFKLPLHKKEVALFSSYSGLPMKCFKDDFVVRGNQLGR